MKARAVLAIAAVITATGLASGAVTAGQPTSLMTVSKQRPLAQPSTAQQPFKAMKLERKREDGRVRVRLLIYTKSIHERTGSRVRVFSNELDGAAARARERPCECSGLWAVTQRTHRGRDFLRALKDRLKKSGKVELAAVVKGTDAGPAAAFRIERYNRKIRPSYVTA